MTKWTDEEIDWFMCKFLVVFGFLATVLGIVLGGQWLIACGIATVLVALYCLAILSGSR